MHFFGETAGCCYLVADSVGVVEFVVCQLLFGFRCTLSAAACWCSVVVSMLYSAALLHLPPKTSEEL